MYNIEANTPMKFLTFLFTFSFLTAALFAAEMPNLIKNGSFEEGVDAQGVPKHWIIDRSDKVEGVVKLVPEHKTHGKVAVFLHKKNTRGALYLRQMLRLKPNTEYILELKGYRESGHRWHYVSVRQPDTKVRVASKIPVGGGEIPPIRFRTHVTKTLTYVYFGLWGYTKENNPGTIGKMWVDEVVLRELPRIAGAFKGIGHYYFASDSLKCSLFSNTYKGKVTLILTAANGKKVSKVYEVVPGENPLSFSWKDFPVGEAVLSAKGGDIDISTRFMLQRERN